MPVPKRYFHCSQEINSDPELWAFTAEFGDRSLRTWLQILSILDRSANQWRVSGDWLGTLSRMVRQSVANVSRQIRWLTENEWLLVRETAADGSPLVFEARNWTKYNRSQEQKGSRTNPGSGTQRGLVETPSFPTPTPNLSLPSQDKDNRAPVGAPSPIALWASAEEVISFLNERTQKKFQARHPNGDPTQGLVAAHGLLKKGYTLANMRQVIANRCLKWRDDPKMEEFLRPETLFRPSKFTSYFGELGKGVKPDAMP